MIVVLLASTVLFAVLAPSAWAGWSPAVRIGAGGAASFPVVAFSPTGDAAIASVDGADTTYLVRRSAGGSFESPVTVAAPTAVPGPPQAVSLPAGGDTVVLSGGPRDQEFGQYTGSASWDALVKPPRGATAFKSPQQLAPANVAELSPTTGTTVATARGEVIAVLQRDPSLADSYTMVLPAGGSAFGSMSPYPGPPDDRFSVAADGAGGTFLAWDNLCGNGPCVAYRPAEGRFAQIKLGRPPGCKFNCQTQSPIAIAAAGNARAALGEVYDLITRGAPAGRVAVEVGSGGSLGPAHVLATTPFVANTELLGPAITPGGGVTIGWSECGSRELGCSIGAALGNVRGDFGRSQTLASIPRNPRLGLRAWVAPGTVALQRCGPSSKCSISVALATRGWRFRRPTRITTDGEVQLLTGNAHGDEVMVWASSRHGLFAAVRRDGARPFGRVQRLAPDGTIQSRLPSAAPVTGAFGPGGEAIVAWADPGAGAVMAAVYTLGG